MSRIEQALEKAVKMRESGKGAAAEETPVTMPLDETSEFEAGDAVIDLAAVDRHLVTLTDPYSHAAEQYRKLRARVLGATRKDFHNTIMITSADISEGKSLTALNLAVALANEIDHTVLLVDADLRNPSLHAMLGLEPGPGLSDYLKGDVTLPEVLVKTGIGKLIFLPGGNPAESSAELLSSEKMKMLVHELKRRYRDRYVIFDTSPLLLTADALSLGSCVDGALFVIQEGRTARHKVAQSISLLKGCNILGVAFNNASQSVAKELYPYYYRYAAAGQRGKPAEGNGGAGEKNAHM